MSFLRCLIPFAFLASVLSSVAEAQLNQNCVVSVLNRTITVNPDGSWVLPNVPANIGQVKARATCVQNGVTRSGESAFFAPIANGAVNLPDIQLGAVTPIPVNLTLAPANQTLSAKGATVALTVTANYSDGATKNVTAGATGTNYTVSNPAIATISANGLVTAVSSGTVVIQANHDGATGMTTLRVALSTLDSDGDGIPDDVEIANGLNPNNPVDALEDYDRDGLTNKDEIARGTFLRKADSDDDGLNDGNEVARGTNPMAPDTDGDRIPDGVEVQVGTNPLDPKSVDLKASSKQILLTPATFRLATSVLNPTASQQLKFTAALIDDKTVLDLTSTATGTTYQSSDLAVCSFGADSGRVYSGSKSGPCVVTATNGTGSAQSTGTSTSVSTGQVSSLGIPGSVAVAVAGDTAFVSLGTSGVAFVNIADRSKPQRYSTLGGLGNVQGLRAAGQFSYVADANGFLRILGTLGINGPSQIGFVAIPGSPVSVAQKGSTVAVAAGAGGVSFVDVSNPAVPKVLSTFPTTNSAQGVDFDTNTKLAAVALGGGGLQILDISNLAAPVLRGTLAGGNVRQVVLMGNAAVLADSARSVTGVDLSNPASPRLVSSTRSDLGGAPVDIAALGRIAFTADASFGRASPILDVSDPTRPSTLVFWNIDPPAFGSSIAMDSSFAYLIVGGSLRIYKYQDITDNLGVPPVVSVTAPKNGEQFVVGSTVQVAVNATDDVAVASVTVSINGSPACTMFGAPYQCPVTVPETTGSATISAVGVDYGGNASPMASVVIQLIPDPFTTVTGRVVSSAGTPIANAWVKILERYYTQSNGQGLFTVPNVSTVKGAIAATAVALVSGAGMTGSSVPKPPVLGGTTALGDVVLNAVFPPNEDPDGDELKNSDELVKGTSPFNPDTDGDKWPDGIEVALGSDPLNPASTPRPNLAAEVGLTFSLLNKAAPFLTLPSPLEATTVFSLLNKTAPFLTLPTAQEATAVFSLLNKAAPFLTLPTAQEATAVFSLLNKAAPFLTLPTAQEATAVFSVLNQAAPFLTLPTAQEATAVFSVLNRVTPPLGSASAAEVNLLFSVKNLFGMALVTSLRAEPKGPVSLMEEWRSTWRELRTAADSDGDGLPDVLELMLAGDIVAADPNGDFDGDGLTNLEEFQRGTDPRRADTDSDSLNDAEEFAHFTDPFNADTDGDHFGDGDEILAGTNPLDARSFPKVPPAGTTVYIEELGITLRNLAAPTGVQKP